MADLTVTCYMGWHIVYLAGAALSVIVYCIGVPIVLTHILIFESCTCNAPRGCKAVKRSAEAQSDGMGADDIDEDGDVPACYKVCPKVTCICSQRSSTPWGFRTASFRERFGLLIAGTQCASARWNRDRHCAGIHTRNSLFLSHYSVRIPFHYTHTAGYDTTRGSIVIAWEPLVVMVRKLLITLAGSLPRDPYIQISIALTILVGSITLQALVQPYESTLVNVLDVISLFVLSFTQVLSILYLYLDTKDGT
jgi:hypothetical protein